MVVKLPVQFSPVQSSPESRVQILQQPITPCGDACWINCIRVIWSLPCMQQSMPHHWVLVHHKSCVQPSTIPAQFSLQNLRLTEKWHDFFLITVLVPKKEKCSYCIIQQLTAKETIYIWLHVHDWFSCVTLCVDHSNLMSVSAFNISMALQHGCKLGSYIITCDL